MMAVVCRVIGLFLFRMFSSIELGVSHEEKKNLLFTKLCVHVLQVFVGPTENVEYLQRYVASQTQYLVVKHRDGRKEHLPG